MQYIISCRLAKKHTEICPEIYYFAGFNQDGAFKFDTRKEEAELFESFDTADLRRRILVTRPSVLGCIVEQINT